MSFFGIPFFATGVFLILTMLGVVPVSNENDLPALAWPLLILMAIAFTTVGGVLVFGRAQDANRPYDTRPGTRR